MCDPRTTAPPASGSAGLPGKTSRSRGQIVVLAAISLIATVALAGAAVDVGYARFEKRRMQTAADSAAVAAAYALNIGANFTTAGRSDSTLNGFTDGTNGVTVAINHPPSAGAYSGNSNYVEAVVSQNEPTSFLRVIGITTIPAAARAVSYVGSSPDCVFGLDPSGNAITASGSVSVTSQCGMISDSNMSVGGSATMQATAFDVVGSCSGNCSPPQLSPATVTGVVPVSDPLSYLSEPTTGSCTKTKLSSDWQQDRHDFAGYLLRWHPS